MALADKLRNPLTVRLLVGLVVVLYFAAAGSEWYTEGFLPFSPQR